ncbi:MAG: Gfo/Idh/MocA family oxidoreductase [bacterium]|nr:Gfo/Idh/MocA family oxidoreductase [bacterium]
MSRIVLGFIGLGYWGPNLIRNFHKQEGVRVKTVADLSEDRLAKIKGDFPSIARTTTNYQDLLNDKEIEAIVIATPVSSHFQLAKEALEAGKHVLVEKPMTATVAQAEELLEIAKRKKLTLMVDHTFLFSPQVEKIKELVDSGELGQLHYIDSTRINLGLFQSDINVVWDLAPHDFSIVNHLIGKKPISLSAQGFKHPGDSKEAIAYLTVRYPDDLFVHINVSWLSPVKMRLMLISGDKKMVAYDQIHPSEKIKVYDYGVKLKRSTETPFSPIYRAGDVWIPRTEAKEALEGVCKHFLDCIQSGEEPISGAEQGLLVVKLLASVDQSLQKGGQEIKIS